MAWSAARFSDFNNGRRSVPSQGATVNQLGKNQLGKELAQGKRRLPPTFTANSTVASNGAVSKLESLNIGSAATIIGVIIAKESPKSIFTRKNPGTERYLLSFVVRDSPTAFVNVTCWGSENFVTDLSRSFTIRDVVKISNAQVQATPTDGSDEKFRVSTPLPFQLTLNENHSELALYDGLDLANYTPLNYIPTKPSSDYYTLEDVQANGQSLSGEHINLLAAVRKVGPAKDITTKTGKHTKRCELKLFDESSSSFPLVIWGEELADYAQTWLPMETVLFVADVRMKFDDFRSSMLATADSKTVFTTNPDTVDARCLYQYAQTQTFPPDEDMAGKDQADPPLEEITEVVTVEDVYNRKAGGADYAIIYAIITRFDLDAENTEQFFRKRCCKCKQLVYPDSGYQCANTECTQGALTMFNSTGEISVGQPEVEFSLPVGLSDHTGSVTQCRLSQSVVEAMTGWNVNDLVQLEPERRTELKWNYLLERCKLHVKIIKNFKNEERVSLKVLSCSRADPADMDSNLRAVVAF